MILKYINHESYWIDANIDMRLDNEVGYVIPFITLLATATVPNAGL